jgi:hypothetical protein
LFSPECAVSMTFWGNFTLKLFGPFALAVALLASITCFEEDWQNHLGLIVFGIIAYVLVVPLSLLYVFISHRKDHGSLDFLKNYDLLLSPYRYPCYFWELVLMLKRTLFVVSSDFLGDSSYSVKYGASVFSFLWIELVCLPYSTKTLNMLNIT